MTDESRGRGNAPDAKKTMPGVGVPVLKYCWACELWKTCAGARGVGIRYRCAQCHAKREAA